MGTVAGRAERSGVRVRQPPTRHFATPRGAGCELECIALAVQYCSEAGPMDATPDVIRYFHPVLPAKALGKQPRRVEVAGLRYALFRDAARPCRPGPSGRTAVSPALTTAGTSMLRGMAGARPVRACATAIPAPIASWSGTATSGSPMR